MEGVGVGEMGASGGDGGVQVQVQDAALKKSYTQGELRFLKSQVSSSVVSVSLYYSVSLRVSLRPSMVNDERGSVIRKWRGISTCLELVEPENSSWSNLSYPLPAHLDR